MYVTLKLAAGEKKKNIISHHDFRKSIALTWFNLPTAKGPSNEISKEDLAQSRRCISGIICYHEYHTNYKSIYERNQA